MSAQNIPYIDESTVDNAVSLWRKGQLVAFPTETVYGLGADATNGHAVAAIYSVKARPQFNPLITHVATAETAKRYVEWSDNAERLAVAFWPGPLTLVLPRLAGSPLSDLVSAGGTTAGIRVPSHPVAQRLLSAFGGAIAAPSANRSGKVSPTTAAHVKEELAEEIPLIVDGGACVIGLESTVIDLSGEHPEMLRPGSITKEMVERALGHSIASGAASGTLKSPGLLASHYAPSIPVYLDRLHAGPKEALLAFGPEMPAGAATTLNLSMTGNLEEAAANLFSYLRALDNGYHSAIAVMPVPDRGIGEAINDRLRRAAAERTV